MKCAGCPLFASWNNESDRGEACGMFGAGWDSRFQYEDKDGNIVGCYIDRHFIERADKRYQEGVWRESGAFEDDGNADLILS